MIGSSGEAGRRGVLVVVAVVACLVALVAGFGAATATESAGSVTADAAGNFQLSELVVPANVSADETVRVFVDVDNTGTAEATQTVELRVDGSVVESTNVTLAAGAAGTLQFRFGSGRLSAGSHTVSVSTENDSETGTLTVASGTANVSVERLTAPASVTAGETFTLSAVLNNTGTAVATPTVEVRANGSVFATRTVNLNATESATVSFPVSTTALAPGTYTFTAVAAGDSASTTVSVGASCDLAAFVQGYDASGDCAISLTELGRASADFANGDITLTQLGRVSAAFANTP